MTFIEFMKRLMIAGALACVFALIATSINANAGTKPLQIKQAWARSMVPGQNATGVFMQMSAKNGAKLLSASSPAAARAEIHEMTMDSDSHVMKMREVNSVDLPAGKVLEFKPGGYHIMLFDVKKRLKKGDEITLTLKFSSKNKAAQTMTVKVPVLDSFPATSSPSSSPAPSMSMEHHHH